jgi:hypothetical protein
VPFRRPPRWLVAGPVRTAGGPSWSGAQDDPLPVSTNLLAPDHRRRPVRLATMSAAAMTRWPACPSAPLLHQVPDQAGAVGSPDYLGDHWPPPERRSVSALGQRGQAARTAPAVASHSPGSRAAGLTPRPTWFRLLVAPATARRVASTVPLGLRACRRSFRSRFGSRTGPTLMPPGSSRSMKHAT